MKKSYLHALLASLYIVALVNITHFVGSKHPVGSEIFSGIFALSLFVLSAATMGYLFLSESILLLLDKKKKEAVHSFLQTVLTFGGIILLIFLVSGII